MIKMEIYKKNCFTDKNTVFFVSLRENFRLKELKAFRIVWIALEIVIDICFSRNFVGFSGELNDRWIIDYDLIVCSLD
jgi:hypothetical protein